VGCKSYGTATSLEEAKAAFRAEHLKMASEPMTNEERRILELLAASDDGSTEALLLAHGFAPGLIESIEDAGLVMAQAERTFAAGRALEFTRVRITDAGRRVLAERQG
jgi:hypothetical protein